MIVNKFPLKRGNTIQLEPFGTATDDNFVAMIQAAHAGSINLQTAAGWKVGDTRTIAISSVTSSGIPYKAQDIDIAISSFDNYENCGCVMQFDFASPLKIAGRMHITLSNGASNAKGYGGSEMCTTNLPALVNALPAYLKGLLITFSCKASKGNQSTTIETITNNKLALRSEIEIFGNTPNSIAGEGSQIPYYTNDTHKKKGRAWWLRSPSKNNSTYFCRVTSSGAASPEISTNVYGVSPFGCI